MKTWYMHYYTCYKKRKSARSDITHFLMGMIPDVNDTV